MNHTPAPSESPGATPAMRISDLTLAYQRHPAVHHLSGHFARGSLTAVVGPNGAGKSSLLEALMGRLRAASGRIDVAPDLQGRAAYLPQQAQVDRSFPVRVLDVAMLGHWRPMGLWARASAAQTQQALQALAAVGLQGFEDRWVSEMSVGQFQRLLFARLLLQDAPIILLDEPFNAIDERTCGDLMALVQRWHGEGRTVVAVLHDLAQVRRHFPQTLLLAREQVAWGPTNQVLTDDHLARARQMSLRWDEHAAWCDAPLASDRLLTPVHTPALSPRPMGSSRPLPVGGGRGEDDDQNLAKPEHRAAP